MGYLTVKKESEKCDITTQKVNHYCFAGDIPNAIKKGNLWGAFTDRKKPRDNYNNKPKFADLKNRKIMTSDLHIHPLSHKYYFNMDSGFSDVVLDEEDKRNIRAVVDWCYYVRKLDAIALTDHDMIQASLCAKEYVKQKSLPIQIITGAECTVCDPKEPIGKNEVHLLCLGIDKLPKYTNETSIEKMIEKVRKLGGYVIMSHPIKYPKSFKRYCHLLDGYEYLNSYYKPFDEGREILLKNNLSLYEYCNSDYHYESGGIFVEANSPFLHCNYYEGSVLYGTCVQEGHPLSETEYMSIKLSGNKFPDVENATFLSMDINDFFTKILSDLKIKSRNDVVKMVDGGTQRSYYYSIMNGEKKADLDYYVRIALALGLNLQTTQSMLAISGYGCMHPRIKRHAQAIFAINHKYSVSQYNEFLLALNQAVEPNDATYETRLPDTEEMWDILEGDEFPQNGFLLKDKKQFFDDLLEEYGVEKSEIIEKALMDKGYGYEVLGGRVKASRDYYIRLALEIGLDLRTTQRLLAITDCGCLYSRLNRDGAIIFSINNKFSYEKTIELLYAMSLDPLDGKEKGMEDFK